MFRFQVSGFRKSLPASLLAGGKSVVYGLWSVVIACLLCSQAIANPVLDDPEDFSGGANGWSNTDPPGTELTTVTTPGTYLRISFGDQGLGPPSFEEDTIYTEETNETGNMQTNAMYLRFGFMAEDVLPLDSAIYLHENGELDSDVWVYDFNNAGTGSWETQTVSFAYSAGWSGPGGEADFWDALANVDWIGINVARKFDTVQQDYGLRDWEYYSSADVPEPATVFVLLTAILSMGFTFRNRRIQPANT